ncbi:MAG: DUF4349 domain-containing protein [Candidatus Eremiobacteraeota bacterium]|nr:DUF4349 domain-containing protein [Candidatus Eremiobacteraeota bacterium]
MIEHEIAELLPFYANGTLDAADRARVEAELETCGTCAAELQELQTLAAALRARADDAPPLPEHLLVDALTRITPRPRASASAQRGPWWGTPARYATAAVLVVSVGAAAVAAYRTHEAEVTRESQVAVAGHAQEATRATVFRVQQAPRSAKVAQNADAAAPAPQSVAKQHRLAKTARIEVLVRDVESALARAQATVRSMGGDVTALNDSSPRDAGSVHTAALTVEVPADRLDGALDALAALGAVQTRAIDAEDVDATIVDEEARLRNLQHEEADLRALMDKGGKVGEILTVQQNLSDVRGQIEELQAQHVHDLHRVATSTIAITLSEDRPNGAPAKPGASARIDGAWRSGVSALADTFLAFVTAFVWCVAFAPVPLAAGAVAYAVLRTYRMFGSSASRSPSPR